MTNLAHGAASDRPFDARLAAASDELWPHYAEDEIDAVCEVLRSGRVNQWTGDRVAAFERAYEHHIGHGRHAVAMANGSVTLEAALRALGVGPGDEIITTPRTFVASAFAVMLVGATPVFVDVDEDSGSITPGTIAPAITQRTRGILPVHVGGWPADMPGICALAEEHDLLVVEDCAQAHGARIHGRLVGSFGDAASFSFCQDKIVSTGGEGGLVTFTSRDAHDRAWSYKDHGKSVAKLAETDVRPGFRWLHDTVGTNWRMLETSAAIGLRQLAKLERWRTMRAERAAVWQEALSAAPGLRLPTPPSHVTNAWYRVYAYVAGEEQTAERARDEVIARATARGIRVFSGSCSEVYREGAFAEMAVDPLPTARALGRTSLCFEVHPTLDLERLRVRAAATAEIIADVLG